MKRIALLTSGGDCPGLNPCIRAVVRTALAGGIETIGVHRGWRGLIDNEMERMNARSVAGIVKLGGTVLRSSRCPEFREPEARKKAASNLLERGIDGLVVIGGDGSLNGASELARQTNLPLIGIPKTIDNDVGGTDYALGFDTAVNTAIEAIDKIRDTATSHERLFLVEVMGRNRGFLSLQVALACGAEGVLMPEVPTDITALCAQLERCREAGKVSSIVVVAEGDDAGNAYEIARKISDQSGYNPRVSVLGYIQRGGAPSAADRVQGGLFGKAAVDALLSGESSKLVASRNGQVTLVELELAWKETRELPANLLELARVLAS